MAPPLSRMDILSPAGIDTIVRTSKLIGKYNTAVDSQSAYEILTDKLNEASEKTQQEEEEKKAQKQKTSVGGGGGFFDNPMVKQAGRTAASVITRGLLGALGLGGRGRKKSGWF